MLLLPSEVRHFSKVVKFVYVVSRWTFTEKIHELYEIVVLN